MTGIEKFAEEMDMSVEEADEFLTLLGDDLVEKGDE